MKRQSRQLPSVIRVSDWNEQTIVCDLCGKTWKFDTPLRAILWMGEHKRFHLSD